jgi:cytosine/adenosine deaminase-related metal-dependent hydrolase
MQWLTADIVFDGYEFHSNYFIQVDNTGRIRQIKREKPNYTIKKLDGLLMPGMVNAHCHLELSYTKGLIPEKTGLSKFLQKVNEILPKKTDEQVVQDAIIMADAEMQKNGIMAVGDICNTAKTLSAKIGSKIHYHNFVECIAIQEADVQNRFAAYQKVYEELQEELETTYSLHTPYTCHADLYKLVDQHSDFISIHNQESEAENQLFERKKGSFDNFYEHFKLDKNEIVKESTNYSSFENSQRLLSNNSKKLFVHNTYTRTQDLELADTTSWFCFCPKANLYIENQLPNIPIFKDCYDKIVLGTDSLASNDSLNILSEVKTIQDHFPEIPLKNILQWATSNGAKLFGLERELGSFDSSYPGFVNVPDFNSDLFKLESGTALVIK